jgi:glycerol-3-phosphate dehydrogenase
VKRDLAALTAREHDVVVVGGGIQGVATAYDAAQRGLSVALVEASDFGSGVSWNSLKTIHGGLRHLQRADLAQARESMRERRALLRIAPEIVRPLPFLVPTYGHGLRGREAVAAALRLHDLIGLDRNEDVPPERRIPPSRVLPREEMKGIVPGLDDPRLTGGAVWFDAQVTHGERLIMAFCHAAADAGAALANYVAAIGFLRSGRAVTGIRARDVEGGGELEIRARMVVIATGPGVDRLLARAEAKAVGGPMVLGMNLVLARPLATTHAVGASSGGRFLFLVPWRDRSIVGTAYDPPTATPDVSVSRFVEEARRAFPWAGLGHGDVSLVHRGLVPARRGGRTLETRSRVVDHEAADGIPGLVSMRSVKLTTARAEAEKAVDLVLRRLGRSAPPCRTATTPLRAARPLQGSVAEQTVRALREEMALHLADVVLRRTDLGTAGAHGERDLDAAAAAVASARGWDEGEVRAEREAFRGGYASSTSARTEAAETDHEPGATTMEDAVSIKGRS